MIEIQKSFMKVMHGAREVSGRGFDHLSIQIHETKNLCVSRLFIRYRRRNGWTDRSKIGKTFYATILYVDPAHVIGHLLNTSKQSKAPSHEFHISGLWRRGKDLVMNEYDLSCKFSAKSPPCDREILPETPLIHTRSKFSK